MELKDELLRALAEPIETSEQAERAREVADLVHSYLQIEEEAKRLLHREVPSRNQTIGDLTGLTLHEAARRVLEDAGVPLHARELGARMKTRGWRHPRSTVARPEQVMHQLAARLPRHPKVFRRVAPQTFALARWGQSDASARRRPRLGLFSGPGTAIAKATADADEPLVDEGASWRSS